MTLAVAPLDITIPQGDGFTATLWVKDRNKKAIPLPTGTAITMIVRPSYDPVADPVAVPPTLILKDASQPGGSDAQIKIVKPNEGQVLINITDAQTAGIPPATYQYVIRVALPSSSGPRTVTHGDFTIEPNITA